MGMSSNGLSADVAQMLAEMGFLAVRRNRLPEAQRIFTTLRSARPDADYPVIGQALVAMTRGAQSDAANMLRAALVERPGSEDLKALLALALLIGQQTLDADEIANELLRNGQNPQARALALAVHDEAVKPTSPTDNHWHGGSAPAV